MAREDALRYLANPEVSCREEGPDGALLFNPDTDQVLLINPVGLVIWQALERPRTLEGIIAFLKERCDRVPEGQVHQDVSEFIAAMVDRGFIGIVREG